MNSYFDLLIQKLHEKIGGSTRVRVNIVRWFNFTLFDLVGDLCFGEDFDALKTEEYVGPQFIECLLHLCNLEAFLLASSLFSSEAILTIHF